jgi:PAS domain S-box-containing protein
MKSLNQDQQRDVAASRLKTLIPEIMRRWEVLVLKEVPAARLQERLLLYNDIPAILAELAQALAIGEEDLCTESEATRSHAQQRVGLVGYSLSQLIQEYHVLRRVVVEELEAEVPLSREALAVIHGSLDHSIEEAVTEYARLQQQELSETNERYRMLVDGVKDYAIFMLDEEGRVTTWNEGAQRIFGFTEHEILGEPFARFFTPEAAQHQTPERELREAARQGRCESEGWRLRHDGTRFWATGVLTAFYDAAGRLRGFSQVTRDITERKFLEDQLLRTADELAQRDRNKNEFLAMLAHELRSPLSAISNSLYLLENIPVDDRTLKQVASISRQTGRVRRLVEDLLDLSRISTGKLELRRRPIDLIQVTQDAVQTVRSRFEARDQCLDCSFPVESLWVEGDATRLEQIVTNLLDNAAKYTEPGGEISLALAREGEQAVLRLRDSGVGIEAGMLPSIFDLFTQVDASQARSQGGLGIGLSLVKRLVELHGGSVTASSAGLGAGSEFVVRLPLLPVETAEHR